MLNQINHYSSFSNDSLNSTNAFSIACDRFAKVRSSIFESTHSITSGGSVIVTCCLCRDMPYETLPQHLNVCNALHNYVMGSITGVRKNAGDRGGIGTDWDIREDLANWSVDFSIRYTGSPAFRVGGMRESGRSERKDRRVPIDSERTHDEYHEDNILHIPKGMISNWFNSDSMNWNGRGKKKIGEFWEAKPKSSCSQKIFLSTPTGSGLDYSCPTSSFRLAYIMSMMRCPHIDGEVSPPHPKIGGGVDTSARKDHWESN